MQFFPKVGSFDAKQKLCVKIDWEVVSQLHHDNRGIIFVCSKREFHEIFYENFSAFLFEFLTKSD